MVKNMIWEISSTNGSTRYKCSVEVTLDVIGGKWKALILFHLLSAPKRFGELRRLMPGVTQGMLTTQLRDLERDGIIHREIFREIPPRVEYSVTEFGESLRPVIVAMGDWGNLYAGEMISKS
jgi:DNA-binding HxlR family transcriptional regulator